MSAKKMAMTPRNRPRRIFTNITEPVPEEKQCPTSPTGKHTFDIHATAVCPSISDEDTVVVDVNCNRCGASGSATIKTKDILW